MRKRLQPAETPRANPEEEKLLEKEKCSWGVDSHALNSSPGAEDQVQGFKNKSKLFLGSKEIKLTSEYYETHFFVTDKKIVLELVKLYTCGASISQCDYKVQISDFVESDDMVEEVEFRMNKDVRKRMLQVIGPGNFNFSHVFRNSEHIARYVHSGAWISLQMNQDSMTNDSIRRIFDSHMSDDQKKLINTPPKELIVDEEGSMEVIYAEQTDHVNYEQQTRLILNEDKDSQNIVFIGPTGCGKSNLVNQLYNKKVVRSKGGASSVTRNMQFTQGHYNGQKYTIVDTIGLCDTVLSEAEVYDMIKDSIRANLVYIDKVVIVCSGRIEPAHKAAVKNVMNWLNYPHNKQNFIFVYNKSDGLSEETRHHGCVTMCEEFGADISIEQPINSPGCLAVKCVQALGLKPGLELSEVESDLTNFRKILISEPTSRIDVNLPITRGNCIALLALLKQKEENEKKMKLTFSKQKQEMEKEHTTVLTRQKEEMEKEHTTVLTRQKEEMEKEHTTALTRQKEEMEKERTTALTRQKEEMEHAFISDHLTAPVPDFQWGGYTISSATLLSKLVFDDNLAELRRRKTHLTKHALDSVCTVTYPDGYVWSNMTALSLACWANKTDCAELLLTADAEVNTAAVLTGPDGRQEGTQSPLYSAVCHQNRALVTMLRAKGARTDVGTVSVLDKARERGLSDMFSG